ncbi:spore coat U domain-containing protein, partial [Escherichia coli]|nr:spore coat U domain-containing protein [Escherichia coli]
FSEQDGVVNGGSATGIEVLCSNGVTPTFTLGTGLYDASATVGTYAMSNGAQFIDYTLFTDSDRSTQIIQGGTVALSEFT